MPTTEPTPRSTDRRQISAGHAPGGRRAAHRGERVFLRARPGGWALITRDGSTIVSGAGPGGRRRCLEVARRQGILAVLP